MTESPPDLANDHGTANAVQQPFYRSSRRESDELAGALLASCPC
jgi:hypothetical protein